jgi:hypothetical protein
MLKLQNFINNFFKVQVIDPPNSNDLLIIKNFIHDDVLQFFNYPIDIYKFKIIYKTKIAILSLFNEQSKIKFQQNFLNINIQSLFQTTVVQFNFSYDIHKSKMTDSIEVSTNIADIFTHIFKN